VVSAALSLLGVNCPHLRFAERGVIEREGRRGAHAVAAACPLCPQKRTNRRSLDLSALCQKRTNALQQRDLRVLVVRCQISRDRASSRIPRSGHSENGFGLRMRSVTTPGFGVRRHLRSADAHLESAAKRRAHRLTVLAGHEYCLPA
jgi:hypothetical protein